MRRRPLNEIDVNKPDEGVDGKDDPNADPLAAKKKKSRSGVQTVAKILEVIELLDDEDDEMVEVEATAAAAPRSSNLGTENSATGALKRSRRNSVTKRIQAPAPLVQSQAAAASAQDNVAKGIKSAKSTRSGAKPAAAASAVIQLAPGHTVPADIEDIDRRRQNDPGYATVYAPEAYEYLRELQFKYPKPPGSRESASEVAMREKMVDWMVTLAEDFAMSSDVLFLSVSIYDRIPFSLRQEERRARLVASTAMLLACKYEDVVAPSVDEIATCLPAHDRKDIIAMEKTILQKLDYRMMMATSKPFLRRFQRAACVTVEEKMLGNMLAEFTLVRTYFTQFTPSLVAAAAVYVARFILFSPKVCVPVSPNKTLPPVWTRDLEYYTTYKEVHLLNVAAFLLKAFAKAMHYQDSAPYGSIIRKYKNDPSWQHISKCPVDSYLGLMPDPTHESFERGGR